jgi:hypothetical protein
VKDVVQTAVECESCGEYTMFGVIVPDNKKLQALVDAASVLAARLVLGIPPRADTARVLPEHSDPAAWWDDIQDKLDAFLALEATS